MSLWTAALIGVANLVALFLVVYALTTRGNQAGIVTSRFGRNLRLAVSGARMFVRWLTRRLRRLVTPRNKLEALDRAFHDATAKAALETMGHMKGALMKLGQIVSFMDDALPPEYQAHLRALQCQAPPMSYEAVARVFQLELGHAPERYFADFDETPLAAASIGQVHRARLYDGTAVAVKIQYPGVDRAIAADLDNAGLLMALIGAVTPTLDAAPLVEELRSRLLEELDYRVEAANQALFAELFEGDARIHIPGVFVRQSSQRVLTTALVEGANFYTFIAEAKDAERRIATRALHKFVFDSMFVHNVFNGDPHPGNYLFCPDGRVAFLDFGCVKRFAPKFMSDFKTLNRLYLVGEKDAYFQKICAMGFIREGHEHKVDRDWLWGWARWFYEPILFDQPFRFTGDYCRKAVSTIFGENMRLLNMPAEYLMLNRITFGLNSILAKLEANENWHRLSMRYYFPELPESEASALVTEAVGRGVHGPRPPLHPATAPT